MTDFTPRQSIHELGEDFFDAVEPADFNLVGVRHFDEALAKEIGLDLSEDQAVDHFLRFEPLEGSLPEPLALRYHGHQFRHYNPDIGDGRGFLFAQCEHEGKLLDFGTKGSGTTPFSRSGDGRLTLLGGVREVLATTHLHAMGVNTSRTLSLIETDEALQRHDEPSPTRAAVMTRLSHSHIRFGTFQRQAFFGKTENLEALVQYCIRHFYAGAGNAAELFDHVVTATANTVASWMAAGFVHGVMNTDNMNITGESFDYGPYRFLPYLEPGFTAAYFDHNGLYAYARQPDAMVWNLAQLAQCLSLITKDASLIAPLDHFAERYQTALNVHVLRRLGVASIDETTDTAFIQTTFKVLKESKTLWPQFWHDWHGGAARADGQQTEIYDGQGWTDWAKEYAAFEAVSERPETARAASLLYDEIGALWKPIAEDDDWAAFEAKLGALSNPV